jgi:glycosyltransferase involved in cell wall biosynthesis
MSPLVSVITPTWRRHRHLLHRCIPSVQAQTYPNIEHVVVSDGPDPGLAAVIPPDVVYAELPYHASAVRWGLRARLRALELSTGEYIAYLDDDDAWRPAHAAAAAWALDSHPAAGFGWTRMCVHLPDGATAELGGPVPSYGRIASSQLFHRRELLGVATWRDAAMDDWDLVERWVLAGARYVAVDEVTADYHRSRPAELGRVITR